MRQNRVEKPILLLDVLQNKQSTGTLYLELDSTCTQQKSHVLAWKNGQIVYGGLTLPNAQEFVKILERKLRREWVNTAVSVAMTQLGDRDSIRVLLERLVEMRLLRWEQVEALVYAQIILTLEQLIPHAVQFRFDSSAKVDICRSWELSELMLVVAQRQDRWSAVATLIPSTEVIPQLQLHALPKVTKTTSPEVVAAIQHLHKWVDGQRNIGEIAQNLDKDPLQIAQSYYRWIQDGWVAIDDPTARKNKMDLPLVLVVDDSALMLELIGLTLATNYRVLKASNAVDALSLLYHEKISLLLLDVSMPGIDGLELCRTVRNLPQFRDLPIVMLTAKDKFFDKVKGHIAGATEYLTKPFDGKQLFQVVEQYVQAAKGKKVDTQSNLLPAKSLHSNASLAFNGE